MKKVELKNVLQKCTEWSCPSLLSCSLLQYYSNVDRWKTIISENIMECTLSNIALSLSFIISTHVSLLLLFNFKNDKPQLICNPIMASANLQTDVKWVIQEIKVTAKWITLIEKGNRYWKKNINANGEKT